MKKKKTAKHPTTNSIILASESPRRSELLNLLKIEFEILPSNVDESISDKVKPQDAVIEIARRKGLFIADKLKNRKNLTIISADTTVVLKKKMLGKPESKDEAKKMLRNLSGKSHKVLTGVFIIARRNGVEKHFSAVEVSKVSFRTLDEKEIVAYVESGEPMDKAGAYALQGLGGALVDSISGCYTNIIGLPIPLTISLLRKAKIKILGCP